MSWSEQETAEYFYRESLVESGVSIEDISPLEGSSPELVSKINEYFKDNCNS